jgi:pentatricopeptide repeat protein
VLALQFHRQMLVEGFASSLILYNVLALTHLKAGLFEEAWNIIREKDGLGFGSDEKTYWIMLSLCAATKNGERAVKIMKEMKSSGVQLSVNFFNDVLAAQMPSGEKKRN